MYQCHSSAEETKYTTAAPVSPASNTFRSPDCPASPGLARNVAHIVYASRMTANPDNATKATTPVSVPCSR